jgi:hypothetical protein
MRMALQLNDLDQATHLEQEVSAIASRMKLALWDPDAGTFRSRAWDGPMTDEVSATALLSLIGGMPSRTQMHQVVDYLSREFLAPYLIPTVGRSDSAFGDQLPWRGRVSALLNALICEGLRHFGQDDWAELITLSGLDLISKSWQEQRQVFAHYQAVTGTGDDIPQDPLAPAGMLFSALGIAMLIDVEPWDGMRLGNISGAELSVSGLELHGERYDLSSGPWGFSTVRNGDPWWEADRPIILRNLYQTDKEVSFHAKVGDSAPVRLRFYGYQPGTQVSVRVNGQLYTVVANEDGVVDFQANIPPTPRPGGGPGRMMT